MARVNPTVKFTPVQLTAIADEVCPCLLLPKLHMKSQHLNQILQMRVCDPAHTGNRRFLSILHHKHKHSCLLLSKNNELQSSWIEILGLILSPALCWCRFAWSMQSIWERPA